MASNNVRKIDWEGGTIQNFNDGVNPTQNLTISGLSALAKDVISINLLNTGTNSQTFFADPNHTITVASTAPITGGGGFIKAGAGTLILNGANSYTGTTTVDAGTLDVGGSLAVGSAVTVGAATLKGSGSVNGSVSLTGNSALGPLTIDNTLGVTGTGNTSTGFLSVTGATTIAANAKLTKTAGALNGSGGITVNGTLQIDGGADTNAATAIAVNTGGTLIVNGSANATGGTISGSGTVANLTIGAGGTLSPGNSPGIMGATSATFTGAGNYNWQLFDASGAAGTGYDLLSSTGALDLSGASGFKINLWTVSAVSPDANGPATMFDNSQNYTWTLATAADGITGFNAANFNIVTAASNGTGGFQNNTGGGTFTLTATTTDLNLNFIAVPEPTTFAMLLGGAGMLTLLRRRRSAAR